MNVVGGSLAAALPERSHAHRREGDPKRDDGDKTKSRCNGMRTNRRRVAARSGPKYVNPPDHPLARCTQVVPLRPVWYLPGAGRLREHLRVPKVGKLPVSGDFVKTTETSEGYHFQVYSYDWPTSYNL